jgi:hypothetical protein
MWGDDNHIFEFIDFFLKQLNKSGQHFNGAAQTNFFFNILNQFLSKNNEISLIKSLKVHSLS